MKTYYVRNADLPDGKMYKTLAMSSLAALNACIRDFGFSTKEYSVLVETETFSFEYEKVVITEVAATYIQGEFPM